jgi:hypothetical protein
MIRTNKLKANMPSIWQEFTLGLIKQKDEPLGVVVEGGASNFDDENIPLFVSYVEPKSFMDKTKHIRKGDLIIKINDESLIGVTNKQASDIIEKTFRNDMISIAYVRSPDFGNDDDFFRPTWNYFISIPM